MSCCLKYFLSRALATILVGGAELFRHLRSLRVTAAEVWVILWVYRYKFFSNLIFTLISHIFINIGDFAIQTFLIKNI